MDKQENSADCLDELNKNLEYYKCLVNNSELFALSESASDEERKRLRSELLSNLYNYYYFYLRLRISKEATKKHMRTEVSSAMADVFLDTLNGYDPAKGEYIKYFARSLSNEMRRHKEQNDFKNSKNLKKDVRIINSIAQKYDIDLTSDTGLSAVEDKVREIHGAQAELMLEHYREYYKRSTPVSIDADNFGDIASKDMSIDDIVEQEEAQMLLIKCYQIVFDSLQERQKPIRQKLITYLFLESNIENASEQVKTLFYNSTYFSQEISDIYSTNKNFGQRDLAELCGVSESQMSNVKKDLEKKVKEVYQQKLNK